MAKNKPEVRKLLDPCTISESTSKRIAEYTHQEQRSASGAVRMLLATALQEKSRTLKFSESTGQRVPLRVRVDAEQAAAIAVLAKLHQRTIGEVVDALTGRSLDARDLEAQRWLSSL